MTILFRDLHVSIDPAVLLSMFTLFSGLLGVIHNHKKTRRK